MKTNCLFLKKFWFCKKFIYRFCLIWYKVLYTVAAIQLAGIGISLQNMLHKNRQDFELELYHAEIQERTEKDCK